MTSSHQWCYNEHLPWWGPQIHKSANRDNHSAPRVISLSGPLENSPAQFCECYILVVQNAFKVPKIIMAKPVPGEMTMFSTRHFRHCTVIQYAVCKSNAGANKRNHGAKNLRIEATIIGPRWPEDRLIMERGYCNGVHIGHTGSHPLFHGSMPWSNSFVPYINNPILFFPFPSSLSHLSIFVYSCQQDLFFIYWALLH
jgi:hypothetical protein